MAATEQTLPKIFTLQDIEQVTRRSSFQQDLIQGVAKGFVDFYRQDFCAAPIQTLGAPPLAPFSSDVSNYAAQTCIKSGYFVKNKYFVVKVASGGSPWKENSGNLQVYSQESGRLVALLLDEGILTEWRTAAVGALSAQLLLPASNSSNQCIGILGTGVQARYQLEMIKAAVSENCRNVLVWGRSAEKAKRFQHEMNEKGFHVSVAENADELLQKCHVIITTTSARAPVLGTTLADDSGSNTPIQTRLIVCIGSDAPGKTELSSNLVKRAALKIADYPEQSRERGEFQSWCNDQGGSCDDIVPLGKVIADSSFHRNNNSSDDDTRLVIVDSSGVALQDCVVAQMVYDALAD